MKRNFTLCALQATPRLGRAARLAGLTLATFLCVFSAHALPGDYDLSYSADGKTTVLMGTVNAGDFSPPSTTASVLTADQKLVVAGKCRQPSSVGFCLSRFNSDGSQDATFGVAFGPNLVNINLSSVTGIAIDPRDQALVVAGECVPTGAVNRTFCVARFTQNGAFDVSYNGATTFAFAHVKVGRVRVASDGKIRVGAGCPRGPAAGNMDMCILALTASLTPDTAFTGSASHYVLIPQIGSERAEFVADLEYLADGRVFYVGPCKNKPSATVYSYGCYGSVNPDGTHAAGRAAFFVTDYDDYPTQVLRGNDGTLLIAGYNKNSANFYDDRPIFARLIYNPLGTSSFDSTFNPAGAQPGRLFGDVVGQQFHLGALGFALSADQEIYTTVVSHGSGDAAGPFVKRVTVRHSDGTTRATWGGTTNALYDSAYENILIDDAGRVLLSGRSSYVDSSGTIYIGRLQNLASAGGACTIDVDGDGKVSATTDGVLLARAMLGLKGTALTQNATGAGATRTDPDAIRAFLVNRCKMALN